ncbi:MAG: TonB-dependent receptor [Gemmatimonadetes bacterium]|nr:TonB-dependent receptor [Gemmatimonadota bacterium]MCY3676698.1 TonB-dependent receptor [Gemmatimonadota bacterium]
MHHELAAERNPSALSILFLLAVHIAPLSALGAQDTRTIQGVVRDSLNGESIVHAAVAVAGTEYQVSTNADGFFSVVGAPRESFTLRIVHIGYTPVEVIVDSDFDGRLNIEIPPLPVELEGVEFVADEYRLVKATDGVSRVAASPAEMGVLPSVGEVDIFRSLQLLPGISGTRESSSGLYVRGGTPDQNLVLLDGITVYHVDHFFGFFSAFNAEAIKDIQVFKGAFPAQYGGRVSSVVDMTGKTGDPEQMHYGGGLNLLSASGTFQTPIGSSANLLVTGRRSYTDVVRTGLYSSIFDVFNISTGPQLPAGGGPGGGRGFGGTGGLFGSANQDVATPDFHFYDFNAKLTWLPGDRDVVAFSLYGGRDYLDKSQERSLSFTPRGTAGTRNFTTAIGDLTDWGNRGLSGRWGRQWASGLTSNVLAAYSEYTSDYGRNTQVTILDPETSQTDLARNLRSTEDNFLTDLTLRADNAWRLSPNHNLDFGAWFSATGAEYRYVRNDSTTILDQSQSSTRLAAYAQDTWDVTGRFSVMAGGRVSYDQATARSYLEPRASARLALTDRITLKAAAGRYHQFVNRVVNENVAEGSRDFWLLADGDLVDVTASDHLVAGVSYETDGYVFDMELYRKETTGLSEFSLRFRRNDIDPLNLFYAGTGTAQGAEFLAQKKFGAFTGWLSYTLAQARNTFPELNDGRSFPALHDQLHELKAVGTLSLGRWDLASTWTLGSGTPYTAPQAEYSVELLDGNAFSYINVSAKNGLRLPAYHRLDLSARYRFSLGDYGGDLGISVFNAYDRDNVWYRQFELDATPAIVTDVNYVGRVLNLSVRFNR